VAALPPSTALPYRSEVRVAVRSRRAIGSTAVLRCNLLSPAPLRIGSGRLFEATQSLDGFAQQVKVMQRSSVSLTLVWPLSIAAVFRSSRLQS
jgi:hypothetical protein